MTYTIGKQDGQITSTEELPIRYSLYYPLSNDEAVPVVIFLHGFKGFKDWGPFPDACIELAENGFAVVAMNTSRNGTGDDQETFSRLDLFADNTLSQELEDINSLLEAIKSGEISTGKYPFETSRIGIVGHSRGGHSAIVAAAEYEDITCLVTWSAVADYNKHWDQIMLDEWHERGYTEILNTRTSQYMRLNKSVLDDSVENADRVIALRRVKDLYIPVCFIHAKEDESVPYTDVNLLYENCPSTEKKRILIPNTGHTFGGSHPFEADVLPEPFQEVVDQTINWFITNL